MQIVKTLALLTSSGLIIAAVPTPDRPRTNPQSVASVRNPAAGPISLDDLAFSRSIASAAWSADGKQVYVSTNLTGRFNLWRVDAAGSWPVQITQSDDRQGDIAVSPDGRTTYFTQDKGGDEQYDIYAVATGGSAVNLTNTPEVREEGVLPSPDGRLIATSTKRRTDAQVNLAVIDVATRQVRTLTDEADPQWRWQAVAWIDRGRALIANRGNADSTASEIWRIDTVTGKATPLARKDATLYIAEDATADGGVIAVSSNDRSGQLHAGLYRSVSGKWQWLKPTPWEQSARTLSRDGRRVITQTNIDGRSVLGLVDVASLVERELPLPPGLNAVAAQPGFSPDSRRLLVTHSGADAPSDLYVVDVATQKAAPLTQLSMASLVTANLPKSMIATYSSFDGTPVSAIVTMPFNLKRDGRNPAVVIPHGGPTGQTQDGFSPTATALASRGYVVIQPNPRGSTGYGTAFQKANFKDLGGGDLKDEIAAKDFLVATGYVDPRRVGITGGSYGGFMTLMAIGRTPDAFAAAVQMYGIINWRTMWAHEDALLQAYQRSLIGDPAVDGAVYDAASPLTYLQAAKAPLLSLQGDNDIRVPRGQAQEVADLLKAKGNVVETVFYPGEGHGFAKRETQVDALRRTVAWFDRYLAPAGK
ncbi:S9 family peptidase [Sphingosinicellaceae bacterium]|nr:S9 family peptidase [Sphingosinicellaceae bacterium]